MLDRFGALSFDLEEEARLTGTAGFEQASRSRAFRDVALVCFGLIALAMVGRAITQPALIGRSLVTTAIACVYTLGLLALNRRGKTDMASMLLVGANIALMTQRSLTSGGIRAPGVTMFCVIALMAGILLGFRKGMATAVICTLISLALVGADALGLIHQTIVYTNMTYWWMNALYIATTVILLYVACRALKSELDERVRAERRLDLALESGGIGTFEADLDDDFMVLDAQALRIYGLEAGNIVSRDEVRALFHPEDLERLLASFDGLRNGRKSDRVECRIVRRSGEIRHIEIASTIAKGEFGKRVQVGTIIDLTVRVMAERALRDAEQKFNAMVENTASGMALVAPDGQLVKCNPALESILGYSEAELCRMSFVEFTHPDDVAPDLELFKLVMAGKRPKYDIRKRFVTKDGQIKWVHRIVSPVHDGDGHPIYAVSVLNDITGQMEAEEARRVYEANLRDYERRLELALEAAQIGIWEWTPSTGKLVWDRRMYAIYGLPVGTEVNYQTWASTVLPGELVDQEELMQQSRALGHRTQREFHIDTPKGVRCIFAAEQVCHMSGDEPERLIGINIDITRRKEAEEEILRIKNQLETLVRQARIGILVHQNFRPLKVNDEMLSIFGMTEAEALAVTDIRQFISSETGLREVSFETRLEALASEPVIEARCRRKDGEWIDCEVRSFPIQWEGQASICAMLMDVTQRKRLETQLHQVQRLEAIGQMTGGVAHDFNNLLTIILGNAEVMVNRLKDDPIMAELAGMTRQAAEQGAELTSRLLAFSRKQALNIRPTDIAALVGDTSNLIQRVLRQNIEFQTVAQPGLWKALVDKAQLESALLNLAINARDAMPDGGRLTIAVANARQAENNVVGSEQPVTLPPASGMADYIMVAVSDSGTGMDEKTRARAFEPFFTTKDVGKGSGLGLSMVYGFVSQLGGQVKIESEPGRGTTIRLYLPRALEETALQAEVDGTQLVGGDESILLVEDHDLVRRQVEMQLRSMGYHVVCACDGVEALEILKARGDFDLLFTDVVMPRGVSGRELAREAGLIRPGLPVLYTSGFSDGSLTLQGQLDPAVNMLNKPYRLEDLAAKLRHVLARSRRKRHEFWVNQ